MGFDIFLSIQFALTAFVLASRINAEPIPEFETILGFAATFHQTLPNALRLVKANQFLNLFDVEKTHKILGVKNPSFNFAISKNTNYMVYELTGYFRPQKTGKHTFFFKSGDSSSLQIGAGEMCYNNVYLSVSGKLDIDPMDKKNPNRQVKLHLKKDKLYPLKIVHHNQGKLIDIELMYRAPEADTLSDLSTEILQFRFEDGLVQKKAITFKGSRKKACAPSYEDGKGLRMRVFELSSSEKTKEQSMFISEYENYSFKYEDTFDKGKNLPTIYGLDLKDKPFSLELTGFFLALESGNFKFKLKAHGIASLQIGPGVLVPLNVKFGDINESWVKIDTRVSNRKKREVEVQFQEGLYYPIRAAMINDNMRPRFEMIIQIPLGTPLGFSRVSPFELEYISASTSSDIEVSPNLSEVPSADTQVMQNIPANDFGNVTKDTSKAVLSILKSPQKTLESELPEILDLEGSMNVSDFPEIPQATDSNTSLEIPVVSESDKSGLIFGTEFFGIRGKYSQMISQGKSTNDFPFHSGNHSIFLSTKQDHFDTDNYTDYWNMDVKTSFTNEGLFMRYEYALEKEEPHFPNSQVGPQPSKINFKDSGFKFSIMSTVPTQTFSAEDRAIYKQLKAITTSFTEEITHDSSCAVSPSKETPRISNICHAFPKICISEDMKFQAESPQTLRVKKAEKLPLESSLSYTTNLISSTVFFENSESYDANFILKNSESILRVNDLPIYAKKNQENLPSVMKALIDQKHFLNEDEKRPLGKVREFEGQNLFVTPGPPFDGLPLKSELSMKSLDPEKEYHLSRASNTKEENDFFLGYSTQPQNVTNIEIRSWIYPGTGSTSYPNNLLARLVLFLFEIW